MPHIDTPQTLCRAGLARADITPPVGIYHRMWGAALHDRATAVHRPLLATALWMEAHAGSPDRRMLILGLDHCILDGAEMARLREAAALASGLTPEQVQIALSHTHGSGWMSRSRAHLPGGDLIGPYLDELAGRCAALAHIAAREAAPVVFLYGTGRCALAAHRDYWDATERRFVCGYNPSGPADDTVLVAKIIDEDGGILASLVNYACHPTTLAWENTALSPDYVGAMREVVEAATEAPCLFLQGASGDLGPREGYVGDWAVADRNGRQLGYAALSALEALPPPGTRFVYTGAVVSGATLGTWKHEPLEREAIERQTGWRSRRCTVELPYRVELPTVEETNRELARWQAEEEQARSAEDAFRLRECRAHGERMRRQLARLASLPAGRTYPYTVTLAQLGDALWIFTPGELYQVFQTTLRSRFPNHAVVVSTVTGDWQPGYVPPAASYGYEIYQEEIAAVAPGCLEVLMETVTREIKELLAQV
jgi:hypothetical protein